MTPFSCTRALLGPHLGLRVYDGHLTQTTEDSWEAFQRLILGCWAFIATAPILLTSRSSLQASLPHIGVEDCAPPEAMRTIVLGYGCAGSGIFCNIFHGSTFASAPVSSLNLTEVSLILAGVYQAVSVCGVTSLTQLRTLCL